jgi:hypothetical protein
MESFENDRTPISDPAALMERSLIDEFLQAHGASLATLHKLPDDQAEALLKEASRYASTKLVEIESRARFVASIRGDVDLAG